MSNPVKTVKLLNPLDVANADIPTSPMSWNYANDNTMLDSLFQYSAMGSYDSQMALFFTGMDRFHQNIIPSNTEYSGITLVTRPKLNLTRGNLLQDRRFAPLDTTDPLSPAMAIRLLLDTKLVHVDKEMTHVVDKCPLFNQYSPFLTPLSCGLTGMSGWPDPSLQTYTTEGGYHSEDQTFVIGSDELRKTYDLTLNFKDVQGGPLALLFETWRTWMSLASVGRVTAYPEDIDAQRLCYTVSIYRFVLDPTRRFITRYAKATGCFPKYVPLGAAFNVNDYTNPISGAEKFSIQFTANHVAYNDYAILRSFNLLMERYCPTIHKLPTVPELPEFNYMGLPYIKYTDQGIKLVYKDISKLRSGHTSSTESIITGAVKSLGYDGAKKLLDDYVMQDIVSPDTRDQILASIGTKDIVGQPGTNANMA